MAWETVEGNGGGDYEDRERLSVKIGSKFEGTIVRVGNQRTGQYGEMRWVDIDTTDGRKCNFPASGILLDRVNEANLLPGDAIRLEFVSQAPKNPKGNPYNKPILQVNRGGGEAPATESKPKAAKATAKAEPAPADEADDDPGF